MCAHHANCSACLRHSETRVAPANFPVCPWHCKLGHLAHVCEHMVPPCVLLKALTFDTLLPAVPAAQALIQGWPPGELQALVLPR
jgi:hypothetical protein